MVSGTVTAVRGTAATSVARGEYALIRRTVSWTLVSTAKFQASARTSAVGARNAASESTDERVVRGLVEQVVNLVEQLDRAEWLDEVIVGRGRECVRAVFVAAAGRQHDDLDVRRGRISFEDPADFQAGHAGHVDIEEDQRRL